MHAVASLFRGAYHDHSHGATDARRALGNITNVGNKTESPAAKAQPEDLKKPGTTTDVQHQSQLQQQQALCKAVSEPGSPERLMGMSGKELEALEAREEHERCIAHADMLADLFQKAARTSGSWSLPSYEEMPTFEEEEEAVLSPLPERTASEDELPDLPDWFWPLTFELD